MPRLDITPAGSTLSSGLTYHLDGGPNKHDATEIDVEGTYVNIPGSPGDLEIVISGINTTLSSAGLTIAQVMRIAFVGA